MNDELRNRLHRLDPLPDDVVVEAPTSPSARDRLERIMSTESDTIERPAATSSRTRTLVLAAAAAVALIVGVVALAAGGDDGESDVASGPPLVLTMDDGAAMASCIQPSADILADMSPAFSGTVTALENEVVTLSVDRWFAGGDAAVVELHAQGGMAALIAGFDFEVGGRYLITAENGSVNYCGFSGPATPELTALFDEAFGS